VGKKIQSGEADNCASAALKGKKEASRRSREKEERMQFVQLAGINWGNQRSGGADCGKTWEASYSDRSKRRK